MNWPGDFVPFFQLLGALSAALTIGRVIAAWCRSSKKVRHTLLIAAQIADSLRAKWAETLQNVGFTKTSSQKSRPRRIS